ncbi:sn-glycerol 3-phosphate transport system substrate-binding protein [Paenibacillus sp. 1_12]|uniref:ABC transporter substrate-binding protein n=1 Tax=Paenibacillus sp. 1_12 TaxID=1566278 RepID=UPI0008E348CF|nr:ABC transporter substrate-binding protein [Paenibacillus sp. 1_12]SFL23013.1 sn-glycerol 3-phosphate transport system substrate-binding protein [Paenibacillus sp. 1_12]
MKKNMTMLMASTMLIGALAGCSSAPQATGTTGATGSTGTNPAPAAAPAAAAKTGKTTIQYWHSMGGTNGEFTDAMIKRFNASHPNIEVVGTFQGGYDEVVTKLQQAAAAGSAPDVTMLERSFVQLFADADVLEDLTPYMKKSNLSLDDFVQGLMGHSIFNKKLVTLPLNRSTPIMHVNKTMLDEMGLKIPTTWEELKTVTNALVIKDGSGYKRQGMTMPFDDWYLQGMITQSKSRFFSEDGTKMEFIDAGVGLKLFSFLKDLQSTGALFYPPTQDSGNIANQMFTEGKVAILLQSTGSIGGLQKNAKFDYKTAFLPKNEVFATPTGGANVAMFASSKNKEAAWEFLNWLMTDPQGGQQFVIDTGYLPFTKKMVESKEIKELYAKEPNRKVAYDQLQYGIDTNKNLAWTPIIQEFRSAMQAIMYDNKDIQATLATFKTAAEKLLKNK